MTALCAVLRDSGTDQMVTSRRAFITGALSLIAAPAIVRAESIMPIFVPKPPAPSVSYFLGPDGFYEVVETSYPLDHGMRRFVWHIVADANKPMVLRKITEKVTRDPFIIGTGILPFATARSHKMDALEIKERFGIA